MTAAVLSPKNMSSVDPLKNEMPDQVLTCGFPGPPEHETVIVATNQKSALAGVMLGDNVRNEVATVTVILPPEIEMPVPVPQLPLKPVPLVVEEKSSEKMIVAVALEAASKATPVRRARMTLVTLGFIGVLGVFVRRFLLFMFVCH